MKEITVQELAEMRRNHTDFQLIDVREEHEFDMANLGGELIPLGTIVEVSSRISRDKPVVIHCRSGAPQHSCVGASRWIVQCASCRATRMVKRPIYAMP